MSLVLALPAKAAAHHPPRCPDARAGLDFYRGTEARWKERMGQRTTSSSIHPRSCAEVRNAAKRQRLRSRAARRQADAWVEQKLRKWGCIHRHEGSWRDPNGPYYGGLQMDAGFQAYYGREFVRRWGYANHWPIWAQLLAAERAYQDRGFQPWPNTARMCGQL